MALFKAFLTVTHPGLPTDGELSGIGASLAQAAQVHEAQVDLTDRPGGRVALVASLEADTPLDAALGALVVFEHALKSAGWDRLLSLRPRLNVDLA